MSWLGLVGRITRYRKEQLLKARLETEMTKIHQQLSAIPQYLSHRLEFRLQATRKQLEISAVRWENAKIRYQQMKKSACANSKKARALWKLKVHDYHLQFQASQAKWALLIAVVSRLSHHGTS